MLLWPLCCNSASIETTSFYVVHTSPYKLSKLYWLLKCGNSVVHMVPGCRKLAESSWLPTSSWSSNTQKYIVCSWSMLSFSDVTGPFSNLEFDFFLFFSDLHNLLLYKKKSLELSLTPPPLPENIWNVWQREDTKNLGKHCFSWKTGAIVVFWQVCQPTIFLFAINSV